MKEEKRIVALDDYEEGAVITALNDMRNKEIAEENPTDFVDELMLKILHAPLKKARGRDEAR
ncbi:hypothetical protein [Caproiciproducens sp. CPB-2]|uniref:hypothetical protein n=1 Tax=Caproiciproducens sp. CPB-2 TaxID=3030017 RepID=UPI0023DA4930|nr:hypothetical protein [Caproiciproducens sp. CPB-2]MDF1494555.1 hypothetical protein [Caproiciproducens sp. CPB-2]